MVYCPQHVSLFTRTSVSFLLFLEKENNFNMDKSRNCKSSHQIISIIIIIVKFTHAFILPLVI